MESKELAVNKLQEKTSQLLSLSWVITTMATYYTLLSMKTTKGTPETET